MDNTSVNHHSFPFPSNIVGMKLIIDVSSAAFLSSFLLVCSSKELLLGDGELRQNSPNSGRIQSNYAIASRELFYSRRERAAFNQWFQSMGLFATRLTFCPPDTQQDKALLVGARVPLLFCIGFIVVYISIYPLQLTLIPTSFQSSDWKKA